MYATVTGTGSSTWQVINNTTGASVYSSTFTSATIGTGSTSGNFTIKYSLSNSCGSEDRFYNFMASNCFGYYSYTVSPNPARDYLNIEFESTNKEKIFPESFELYLETTYGTANPVRKKEIRDETSKQQLQSTKKFTFDVRNLPRGRYILRVLKEQEKETGDKMETMHIVLN